MKLTPVNYLAMNTRPRLLLLSTDGVMCAGLLFETCIGASRRNLRRRIHLDEK